MTRESSLDTVQAEITAELELLLAGDRATLEKGVREMVVESAPRLFAIVCEHPDGTDAVILGWGLAFTDEASNEDAASPVDAAAQVIAHIDGLLLNLRSIDRVLRLISGRVASDAPLRAIWVDEAAAEAA